MLRDVSSNACFVTALIIGAVVGIGSEALFHLSELWAWLPWIVALLVAGSAYSTLIANAAHERQADAPRQPPEPPKDDDPDNAKGPPA